AGPASAGKIEEADLLAGVPHLANHRLERLRIRRRRPEHGREVDDRDLPRGFLDVPDRQTLETVHGEDPRAPPRGRAAWGGGVPPADPTAVPRTISSWEPREAGPRSCPRPSGPGASPSTPGIRASCRWPRSPPPCRRPGRPARPCPRPSAASWPWPRHTRPCYSAPRPRRPRAGPPA